MSLHSSTETRRWLWLFILLMIGVVVAAPIAASTLQLSAAETSEFEEDEEEVEVDDLLDLIATALSGQLHSSHGQYRHIICDLIATQSLRVACHLQRGPPFC